MSGDNKHVFVRRGDAVIREDLAGASGDDLWQPGEALASARGRAGVRVFELAGSRGVVRVAARDYKRGGLLRSVLGDRYFDRDRAVRELEALAELAGRGLPVVVPVAAVRRSAGVGLKLRLLTELVDGAMPLPAFVEAQPELRREAVHEAGRVVVCAFDAGLLHRDLHADNLIARESDGRVEVLLLDLDRAELLESLPAGERDSMLLRMARYNVRHAGRLQARSTDQPRFLAGMGLNRSARRVLVERLAPELARIVAKRAYGLRTDHQG